MSRLHALLALLLLAGAASASLLRPNTVHLRIGVDDWLKEDPWKVGIAGATQASGYNASLITAIDRLSKTQISATYGISSNYTTPAGDGKFISADGRYILVPIGFGSPYRLMFVRDGLGLLREPVSEIDPPKAALFENTFSAMSIPAGANYTGIYKGPIRAGDILAVGLYTITQKPLTPIGKPTVIEIYMQSAVPGFTTSPITNENFKVWSPQYGPGIAVIQIVVGDTPNAKGERHYLVSNNFYFPAPDGISAIPPVTGI